MAGDEFGEAAQRKHVLEQPAAESVMNALGGGGDRVAGGDFRVVEKRIQQVADALVVERGDDGAQFAPHLAGIAEGGREEVPEIHFVVSDAAEFVDGELRAVVVELQKALHLDEIVAVERVHHLGHVVPHFGVDFAGAVGQQKREIRLAGALLPDLFGVNQKCSGGRFVGFQVAYVWRLHCVVTGVADMGVTAGGGAGLSCGFPTRP